MWRNVTVNLSDLLFSVSEVMDMSDASLADHQVRTAFVTSQMARAAKLDYSQAERLFIAALLHDIGALSPEEKFSAHNSCEDFGTETHCLRGGSLYREAFWLEPSAQIVDWHHTAMIEHVDAGRSLADFNVLGAQIVYLADHLERAIQRDTYILYQVDALRAWIHHLAGDEIHPDVVSLFDEVSATESFWLELVSKDLSHQMRARSLLRSIDLDYDAALSIAGVFKDMTDFRSHFTATHSVGVAACAYEIGEALAFTGMDLQQIYLAGLMHDIGKLVVPNSILCKTSALTPAEYTMVQQHPFYTYRVLSRVSGFEQIAEWAGFHHERLNGSGYCKHLSNSDLDMGAKVIAVADVATAIAESRPYRATGDHEDVLRDLREMTEKNLLEPLIVEVLADNYESATKYTSHAQAVDKVRYLERFATAC
jgi:HD-GYP domain-containing protein (c-di-GMP phosphodiesterase class II)